MDFICINKYLAFVLTCERVDLSPTDVDETRVRCTLFKA